MVQFERSCGVVLFHQGPGGAREYLLLHYPTGHWDFAKGHVEKDEDDLATALREVREETGLDKVRIVDGFRHQFEYFYRHRDALIKKKVSWFLGEAPTTHVTISHEHKGFGWLSFEKALARVTYQNAKDLLKRADAFLGDASKSPHPST